MGFFPTPLHRLDNFSGKFPDYNIFIKRDDQTGLASGGNKTRKLEYLIRHAIDNDYEAVFTVGAQQSNHCRQTAAACAVAGLECHLVLRGKEPASYQGNLLLSQLLGAKLHFTGNEARDIDLQSYAAKFSGGKKAMIIPYGGSNATGAMGFVMAVKELQAQLAQSRLKMDYIFFASSSGGTQAGLILGKALFQLDAELVGIKIDKSQKPHDSFQRDILDIVRKGAEKLNIPREFSLADVKLNEAYNDADYGVLTDNERTAINLLAQSEGILLDPVYTGRAFYGMTDCLTKGKISRGANILFWHTGGLPALFDYANGLIPVSE